MPSCSTPRSAVGDDEHVRAGAERDETDLDALRHLVREHVHRVLRRAEPRRLHVGGAHRARDVDEQNDCRLARRSPRPSRAAAPAQPTQPRGRARNSASGTHRRQGRRRSATTDASTSRFVNATAYRARRRSNHSAADEHERHEQEGEQEVRARKAHGAHSAPTCTIACTSIERASPADPVTTTFLPRITCVALHVDGVRHGSAAASCERRSRATPRSAVPRAGS